MKTNTANTNNTASPQTAGEGDFLTHTVQSYANRKWQKYITLNKIETKKYPEP